MGLAYINNDDKAPISGTGRATWSLIGKNLALQRSVDGSRIYLVRDGTDVLALFDHQEVLNFDRKSGRQDDT